MLDIKIKKLKSNYAKEKSKNIFDNCQCDQKNLFIYASYMNKPHLMGNIDFNNSENLNLNQSVEYFEEQDYLNIQITKSCDIEAKMNMIYASTTLQTESTKINDQQLPKIKIDNLRIVKNKLIIGEIEVEQSIINCISLSSSLAKSEILKESGLTKERIDQVRLGWERIMTSKKLEQLGKDHFQNMFRIDPESVMVFNKQNIYQDNSKFKAHGLKFTSALDTAIKKIQNQEAMESVFTDLGRIHKTQNVKLENFRSMALAFQMTLEGCFGAYFNINQADCFSCLQNTAISIIFREIDKE